MIIFELVKERYLLNFYGYSDSKISTPAVTSSFVSQKITNPSISGSKCSSCNVTFVDSTELRIHFKTPWHLYNAEGKRKSSLLNTPAPSAKYIPISESDFLDGKRNEIEAEEEEGDFGMDLKLLSKVSPFVFLRDDVESIFGVYRAVFPEPLRSQSLYRLKYAGQEKAIDEAMSVFFEKVIKVRSVWTVLLCRGGYFSGVVYEIPSRKVIAHKTFRRYISRRKQGKAQSLQDKQAGRKSNSAGAALRRQNEQHLVQDIQSLLTKDWIIHLSSKIKNSVIFYDNPYLSQFIEEKHPNFVKIPFQTFRPTFEENKRIFDRLTSSHSLEKVLGDDLIGNDEKEESNDEEEDEKEEDEEEDEKEDED